MDHVGVDVLFVFLAVPYIVVLFTMTLFWLSEVRVDRRERQTRQPKNRLRTETVAVIYLFPARDFQQHRIDREIQYLDPDLKG